MKFLIQKINGKILHDFSFTLLESIRFKKWLHVEIGVKYLNTQDDKPFEFKSFHKSYVPVGSVEFVSGFLKHFHDLTPKPINVPEELFQHIKRPVINATDEFANKLVEGKWFIKSNDIIKGYKEFHDVTEKTKPILPKGNYQYSEHITIDSEWRAFVYRNKLVGLQNYSGIFSIFPNVFTIKDFISNYKSAPIAYTLDVSVEEFNHFATDVIEVHDFFSCGLYGFADHAILPNMYYGWFKEYLKKNWIYL